MKMLLPIIVLISCTPPPTKEEQICNCMQYYSLRYDYEESYEALKCLKYLNVYPTLNDGGVNIAFIRIMDENGENYCPQEARKFWFLCTQMDNGFKDAKEMKNKNSH